VKWTDKIEQDVPYPIPAHIDFAAIYPEANVNLSDGILEAPFGYSPTGTTVFYLSLQIDYGYYKGNENANSIAAIDRRIHELQDHPSRDLLVPAGATSCRYFDAEAMRHSMRSFNLAPYWRRPVHLEDPLWPLCNYVLTHYILAAPGTPRDWEYELWIPKH